MSENTCPACGAENPAKARFCMECGAGMESEQRPEERRRATVLFADLSGYTSVAEQMDPEAVKTMVDRALRRLGAEVERHGGTIDKYIGDNVMAVFGAPVAHEDDPERAVRAGLAMQDAMGEVNAEIGGSIGAQFQLRVGINTGEVLAGRVGDGYTVIGDTVNVAARLQGAARPGSVTVGQGTQRITRTAIEYSELEPLELKGKAEPVPAWEALRVAAAGSVPVGRLSSPLIGRESEAELLTTLYGRLVGEGKPHLITLLGEPGVGKSRLLRELVATLATEAEPPAVRLGRCPAYGAGLSYWALGEIVRGQFEILDSDSGEDAWRKLSEGVEILLSDDGVDDNPARVARALARPLGIEAEGEAPSEAEDAQATRERLFSAVRALVEAAARRQPVVFAIEDVHWADEGMLDLVEHLARAARGPVMLVCLARPELLSRRTDWGAGVTSSTSIALDPLEAGQAQQLVQALLTADQERANDLNGHGSELAEQVAKRSGGNPLFAEEMVNRIIEEGAPESDALPDTVHSVLAARLDSLPATERRVLQHASVVGQVFWPGSVEVTFEDRAEEVEPMLASLVGRDLIVHGGSSSLAGEEEYAFKHALVRDVAYGTLPKAVRARLHAEVGGFISERAAGREEAVVAMVAEHFSRAASLSEETGPGETGRADVRERALQTLEAAGDAAAGLFSNQEALVHYGTALDLPGTIDAGEEARIAEKQGDVALRLGRADAAIELWERCLEHAEGAENLPRVGDLNRKLAAALWHKGDREGSISRCQRGIDALRDSPASPELARLYEEAATLYANTGDNMLAIYAAEKALRLAEEMHEEAAAARAHGIFGRVFGRTGDTDRARESLVRSADLARRSDPAESVRALLALGSHFDLQERDSDRANSAYTEGLAEAERLGDLPSQVELQAALGQLAFRDDDLDEAGRRADAAVELAEREGLTGKLALPYALRGALRWRRGQGEAATGDLGEAAKLADGAGLSEAAVQARIWLAGALADNGDAKEADRVLGEALEIAQRASLGAQAAEAEAARAALGATKSESG